MLFASPRAAVGQSSQLGDETRYKRLCGNYTGAQHARVQARVVELLAERREPFCAEPDPAGRGQDVTKALWRGHQGLCMPQVSI